jgi:hypothetical protein
VQFIPVLRIFEYKGVKAEVDAETKIVEAVQAEIERSI